MRLLTGPGVFTKRYASFTPGLAARLVDACLHELPRLLRPYALKLLKPRGSMACSTASCSTCPEVGYTAAVRYGPLALELRYTACRQFASHTAGCSAERVNKYTLGPCCSSLHRRL
jgi:hypothetical protein